MLDVLLRKTVLLCGYGTQCCCVVTEHSDAVWLRNTVMLCGYGTQ